MLSQATSGSVEQVSQLLSLSGTTLDLAATLLTVSVVEIESGDGSSGGSSSGPGQGSRQANGDPNDSADEPIEEDEAALAAIVEWAPAWERLAIGLERSWDQARTAILELEGRLPKADGMKSAAPPADGQKAAAPAPAPGRPASGDRTDVQSRPAPSSGAAAVAPEVPVVGESMHRQ